MAAVEPFFLPAAQGRRFCLSFLPARPPKGLILHLQPFAEELNKSRRNAACAARALADEGWAVLIFDPLGCGDSSGDFGEATWQGWLEDAALAAEHLCAQFPASPLWLWGTRTGALLASEVSQKNLAQPEGFLFWQPTLCGKTYLQQFLRLKVASAALSGEAKGLMSTLKAKLAAGEAIEIAGYELSPRLAQGLENAKLLPPPRPSRVVWLETSPQETAALSPATQSRITAWQEAGHHIEARVVVAPAFWQTVEIEEAPQLIAATLSALDV